MKGGSGTCNRDELGLQFGTSNREFAGNSKTPFHVRTKYVLIYYATSFLISRILTYLI